MDEATRSSRENWAPWALAGVAVVIGVVAATNDAWWTAAAMVGLAVLALLSRAELRRRAHRAARPRDEI